MSTKPVGFWGLVLEPDRMYSQVVPVSFKVTMAALGPDVVKKDGKPSRSIVMLTHQKDGEFALCSLQPEFVHNQTLDLVFLEGETIHFRVVGENAVHLTGYYFDCMELSNGCDGFDSEELEAEMNGEDIEDTDEEEDDDEDDDDDLEMDDFIDDDEDDDEGEDNDEEVEPNKTSNLRSNPRIREVTSDEDEEVESDEAGSVDMSPGRKTNPKVDNKSEKTKRVKVDEPKLSKNPSISKERPKSNDSPKKEGLGKVESSHNSNQTLAQSSTNNKGDRFQKENLKVKTLPSGLKIEDIKLGAGIKAQKGRRVGVSYTVIGDNGKVISNNGSQPFMFNLGDNEIAKGIALGVQGMALGGERKLIVPSNLIDEKSKPALPKSGNCIINIKLENVQPIPKA